MNSLEPKAGERVRDFRFTDDAISVDLFDGRTITGCGNRGCGRSFQCAIRAFSGSGRANR